MRVEAPSPVYFRQDHRHRFVERRAETSDRRSNRQHQERRARHQAHQWFAPALGAHILGQMNPEPVTAERAERAYLQPEARTPLRPSFVKRA